MEKKMNVRLPEEQWAWLQMEAHKRSNPPSQRLTAADILREVLEHAMKNSQSKESLTAA